MKSLSNTFALAFHGTGPAFAPIVRPLKVLATALGMIGLLLLAIFVLGFLIVLTHGLIMVVLCIGTLGYMFWTIADCTVKR